MAPLGGWTQEEFEKEEAKIKAEFERLGIQPLTPEERARMEERGRMLGKELCASIRSHKPEK